MTCLDEETFDMETGLPMPGPSPVWEFLAQALGAGVVFQLNAGGGLTFTAPDGVLDRQAVAYLKQNKAEAIYLLFDDERDVQRERFFEQQRRAAA